MASNDEVIIDLQNYKDRFGSRVVPGRYRVRVEDAELDKTKDGAPMINVWLTVVNGEYEGSTVVDRLLPAHPRALFRVVGFMQAIGLKTPKKRVKLNISLFVGKQLDVDIEDGDPYNGKVKSEVRGYYRIERGTEVKTDLDDLAEDIDPLDMPDDLPSDEEMVEQVAAASTAAKVSKSAQSLKEQVAARQAAQQAAQAESLSEADLETMADEHSGSHSDEDGDFEAVDLENLDLG